MFLRREGGEEFEIGVGARGVREGGQALERPESS